MEEEKKIVSKCRVILCSCICPQQDKIYGKDKRLHNKMKEEGMWRCTCCKKERR